MSDANPRAEALLAALTRYGIGTNPAPEAVYSPDFDEIAVLEALARGGDASGLRTAATLQGFSIWCTAEEHPDDPLWPAARHTETRFLKPCSYLAVCTPVWDPGSGDVRAIQLCTEAFGLMSAGLVTPRQSQNRPADITWARGKIEWIWEHAFPGEAVPEVEIVRLKRYE